MYKTIIPDLVSIDTEFNFLKGFEMCQDFNFYQPVKTKHKYHYRLVLDNNFTIPSDYDFRSEYYTKKGENWYYHRQVSAWHPAFKYDSKTKTLFFNNHYLMLPLKLGGTLTLGEHLSDLVELDLLMDEYVCLRGIAFQKNNQTICISAPGFNGKTTLLRNEIEMGAKYIAEDYLIINTTKATVMPTCPIANNFFWRWRKRSHEFAKLIKTNPLISESKKYDQLIFMENSQNNNYVPASKKIADVLLLNSLYLLSNLFIRSLLYDQALTSKLMLNVEKISKNLANSKFINIRNFDFSSIYIK